ncbi:MAG TPA: hypothetical protein V6D17_14190 [Candidatus Obscuribacterales bacterium]
MSKETECWQYLSPEQDVLLVEFKKRRTADRQIRALDSFSLSSAVRQAYKSLGLTEPRIILCDDPWQLVAMPIFLVVLAHLSQEMRQEFIDGLKLPAWSKAIKKLLSQLDQEFLDALRSEDVQAFNHLYLDPEMSKPGKIHWPGLGTGFSPEVTYSGFFQRCRLHLNAEMSKKTQEKLYAQLKNALLDHTAAPYRFLNGQIYRELHSRSKNFSLPISPERITLNRNGRPSPTYVDEEFLAQLSPGLARTLLEIFFDKRQHLATPDRLAIWFAKLWCLVLNQTSWALREQPWLSMFQFAQQAHNGEFFDAGDSRLLDNWAKLATSQNLLLFFTRACFICAPPKTMRLDEQNRLHCDKGPAFAYANYNGSYRDYSNVDDFRLYCWRGVTVPDYIIENPHKMTVKTIDAERNIEVRRAMIERYGFGKYLLDSNAEKVHEDKYGVLYRKVYSDDEPIVMVHVNDATPQPDGFHRAYFIRVPSFITTAKEAVAWTFNMFPDEYDPIVES